MPEPVPLARVKELLTEAAGQRTLPREAALAREHAELFARLSSADAEKLIAELRTIPNVDHAVAVKIADILPQYPEEVRLLFSRERAALQEDDVTKILEAVARYR